MKDPVMDCFGHTYERREIEKALLHKPGYSPMTNQKYPGGDAKLQTNFALRQAIEEMVPETQQPAGGSARSSAAGESTTHSAERVRPCVLHSRIDRGRFDVLHFHQSPGGDVLLLREVDTSRQAVSRVVVRLTCSGVALQVSPHPT